MERHHLQHLYRRAAFGIGPESIDIHTNLSRKDVVNKLFVESRQFIPLEIDTNELDHYSGQSLVMNPKKRKSFVDVSTNKLKSYNKLWLERLMNSEDSLRERMTLFWANHFVCRDINIYHVQQFNNVLRANALGHFGDFVKAISKEPAMLKYLNNKQNRKQKPNENFARELMELFTLGEGYYTEDDVKESARAFTGYNHNFEGQFILRRFQHDYGFKQFFGHAGRYDGDDIIDILLEQKQCARFICQKIYKYFVNDTINERHIELLTERFYKDYDIEKLMRFIFLSDWFYDEHNIATKIKSPVELLVSINQIVPFNLKKEKDLLKIQKLLGQILLNPPNVAGWKGGKNWIDSNTIMLRLKLPSLLLTNAQISTTTKGGFEDSFSKYRKKRGNNFVDVEVDWTHFKKQFKNVSPESLQEFLIAPQIIKGTSYYLEGLSNSDKQDVCVRLMSIPEFQMC